MKKLVIVVVVLAAVLLIAPYGIGKVAEKRVNTGLDKLVEHAPYFKIAERKWTNGWFKSEQIVTFELSDEFSEAFGKKLVDAVLKDETAQADAAMDAEGTEQSAEAAAEAAVQAAPEAPADAAPPAEEAAPAAPAEAPVRFTVRNEILHGPVLGFSGLGLARVDTHLELPEDVKKQIREVFGDKPALEVSTRVGFFGGGTTTIKSDGRKISPKGEDVEVTYETFKVAVGVGKNGDTYDIDGGLPSIVAKKKDSAAAMFTLTGLTLDGDGKRVQGQLYDGDFAFRIKETKIVDPSTSEDMAIEDVHYLVDTKTKDGFVNMSAQFGAGAVKSKQLSTVGVELKEVHYNFSFNHLQADAFEKMVSSWNQMYTSPGALANMESSVFAPMKEHGAELLKHDPEFGIDRLGIVTPDGEIVAKGVIKLVGATPEDFSAPGAMAVIPKIDADITIEADIKAVNKLPNGAAAVDGAVQSGYAEKKGDKLVCHITFKNGALLVNGKPQAIPGLGGPPPGAEDPNAMAVPQE